MGLDNMDGDTFYHFYDLETAPPTFNFTSSLISSEIARTSLSNCKRTCVVLVPGGSEGFNPLTVYDTDAKRWRLWSIILPLMSLCPSVDSYYLLPTRDEAYQFVEKAGKIRFPLEYTPGIPSDCARHIDHNLNHALGLQLPSLQAPPKAHEYVKRYLNVHCPDKPFVTITLRQAQYIIERNSDLSVWAPVVEYLQQRGYFVFVIPDYDAAIDAPDSYFPGTRSARECVLDLRLRTALYEQATLNLGTTGGAFSCAYHNKNCNIIISNFLVPDIAHSSRETLEAHGMVIGKDANYYQNFARYLWQPDATEPLLSACEEFFALKERGKLYQPEKAFTPGEILHNMRALISEQDMLTILENQDSAPFFLNRYRYGDASDPTFEFRVSSKASI